MKLKRNVRDTSTIVNTIVTARKKAGIPCSSENLADRCIKDYGRFLPNDFKIYKVKTENMWMVVIEPLSVVPVAS